MSAEIIGSTTAPRYSESAVHGTQWLRAWKVQINNEFGATPSIEYAQEKCIEIDGRVIRFNAGTLHARLDDMNQTFPLLDPASNAVVGTASYGQGLALLYSLYIALAQAANTAPPPPNEEAGPT